MRSWKAGPIPEGLSLRGFPVTPAPPPDRRPPARLQALSVWCAGVDEAVCRAASPRAGVCVCVCARLCAGPPHPCMCVCRATSLMSVCVCVQGHLTRVCVCMCVQGHLTRVCVCVQGRLTQVCVCAGPPHPGVCVCRAASPGCVCVCVCVCVSSPQRSLLTQSLFSPGISPHPGVPSYPGQGVGAVSPHLKGGPSLLTGVSPHLG